MIAPPKIIIMRNADPCVVYFPRPAMDNEKILGHMIEQANPPQRNA